MMYTLKRLRMVIAALAIVALPATMLATPAQATSGATIADTAIAVSSLDGFDSNNDDFDILLQALIAADLVGAVADPGADLTVFAPTDHAFMRLARDLGYSQRGYSEAGAFNFIVEQLTALGGGDPIPVLTNVLLYHVSPGSTHYADIKAAGSLEVPTLLGASFTANGRHLDDGAPQLANPRIKRPLQDINTSNGVIHGINRVLIPLDLAPAPPPPAPSKTIAETAIAVSSLDGFDDSNQDFDILIQALIAADLVDAVNDSSAELTVFAPTDQAFMRLARDLGYHQRGYNEAGAFNFIVEQLTVLGGGDPIPVLKNVLLYHVSPGATTIQDIKAAGGPVHVPTLLGANVTANGRHLIDAAPALRNPRIKPAQTNIMTSNGIIHGINRVLIPVAIGGS